MLRLLDLWQLHRRGVLISAGLLAGLLVVLGAVAVLARSSDARSTPIDNSHPTPGIAVGGTPASEPTASTPASDVASWNAVQAIKPLTSATYPAIPATARRDPASYAAAFATELFTRNYAVPHDQLLAWAQYEDAPLRSPHYPRQDWSKVLVDSLTDLSWDSALDTPVPADGLWLALRSESATDSASNVRVSLDPQWEQQIASGYQPPDPLGTARDVTLTLTRHTKVGGQSATNRYAVSLALQLGSSAHGGYGVAATNNYVIKEMP